MKKTKGNGKSTKKIYSENHVKPGLAEGHDFLFLLFYIFTIMVGKNMKFFG